MWVVFRKYSAPARPVPDSRITINLLAVHHVTVVCKMAMQNQCLTAELWQSFFDQDGRLVDEFRFRKTVFNCKPFFLLSVSSLFYSWSSLCSVSSQAILIRPFDRTFGSFCSDSTPRIPRSGEYDSCRQIQCAVVHACTLV